MNLDSVRGLKADARSVVAQLLGDDVARRKLGVRAQGVNRVTRPRSIALGVSQITGGDYKLAVRVQHPLLIDGKEVNAIREMAKGEVEVRYIGQVQKLQSPWYQQQCRPVRIGCSVAHFRVTAGTIGGFVRSAQQDVMILSNNHVLANENDAAIGDAILQPGPFDHGQDPADRVATLTQFIPIQFAGPNLVDCAVAVLDPGISFDSRSLDQIGQLTGVRPSPIDKGDAVAKLGRTTGITRGAVTAFELDNVTIGYDHGNATFDGQIEIEGAGSLPFSQGGDSGSLVVDQSNQAIGLLFAGGDTGGRNGKGLTYANPIQTVLQALSVSLIV